MKRILPIIVVVFIFSNCSFCQKRMNLKNCKFNLQNIQTHSFGLTEMKVGVYFEIMNPNEIDVVVDKLNLVLFLNDLETVKINVEGVTIKTMEKEKISAEVVIPYSDVGMSIVNIIKNNGKIEYALKGRVFIKTTVGILEFPVTLIKG